MVGVAPAANAPSDFDPLDIRNALGGGEDADTAASVPEEMAKALANLTSTKTGAEAADRAPMTMRMPSARPEPARAATSYGGPGVPPGPEELQSEQKEEQPTRIVPPITGASERPPSDFASTMIQKDLAATIAGDVPAPVSLDDIPPSSLARAAQTSFDQRPLERKPLVTTVAMMGPISKIPLPSAARGAVAGNGTVAGVVRATRMPSAPGISPSNTPPRVLSQEQEDMPAPSEGATVMVSPDREAERGPETAPPPVRPQMSSSPETKSVFAPDAPAARALSEPAPSGPSAKFTGTLASASPLVAPSAPSPISPPPASSGRDESTMMVLPEEIIEDEATVAGPAPPAQSPPKHGGTMMMVPPTKQAAPVSAPESPRDETMMLAPMNRAPAPAPQPEMPAPIASPRPSQAAPVRVASNIKTSVGVAPPIFTSPHGPMIPPTPIVSILPAPPGKHQPSITPALPPVGSNAAMPSHNSLPVRPTVQLATTRSIAPPPPPKPLPQTPVMPAAVRASYAQLPPQQWPAEQKMPMPQSAPRSSIGPQSDPHRPLTYSVFDPAEAAHVPVRSPSMPSRASLSDYRPKMSVGVKIGLVVLGLCLVAGTAGAIILGMSEDPPVPHPAPSASSVETSASAFVPVPMPSPVDTTPPPVAADPPPTTPDPASTTSAAPTSTGKQPRRPKMPKEPIPPNPFGSSMPGKRK